LGTSKYGVIVLFQYFGNLLDGEVCDGGDGGHGDADAVAVDDDFH